MKKWTPAAALLATAALLVGGTLPANAATTSIVVTDAVGAVAVDLSSTRVYVGTAPAYPADGDPSQAWGDSAGVAQVDVKTKKVVNSVTLVTIYASSSLAGGISDVEVNPISRDLWVLVGFNASGNQCRSRLYQLDKKTLAIVRDYELGCSRKVEVDPTSRSVYVADAPYYDDRGDDAQPVAPATITKINGATGEVRNADIPVSTTPVFSVTEGYLPSSLAFNARTKQVYVVGQDTAWAFTSGLALVHTTKLGYPVRTSLSVAANPITNQVYVADQEKVTEISGRTNEVTRTSMLSGNSTTVIDIGANVLYRGTNKIKLSTLRSVGQEERVVQAVNPLTRARYSAASGKLYVNR